MITRECRRGTFSWLNTDEFVGRSLQDYGEYSEQEIDIFKQILRPGDVALDVGANIGAFTVPLAQLVGPTGKVYAYEPGHNNLPVLATNVRQNDLENVEIMPFAASDKNGDLEVVPVASANLWRRQEKEDKFPTLGEAIIVPTVKIDDLNLPKCKFVKIDVDGMELEVLAGMDQTIRRCRPYIYIENEQKDQSAHIIAALTDRGYRLWWHTPYQYNPKNFRDNKRNWFGNIVSIMMIAVPEEAAVDVAREHPDDHGWIVDGLDEVGDCRQDDDMFEREIWRYSRYLKYNKHDLVARNMLAHNLNLAQRHEEAQKLIDETLAIAPGHIPTQALASYLQLQRGEYQKAWPGFELRFKQRNRRIFGGHRYEKFTEAAPQWNGEETDKPVMIWSEQGFGDMIMFARLMKEVLRRAPNAHLECHSSLYELFETSEIVPKGRLHYLFRELPPFDFQCSLVSAAAALNADRDMLGMTEPYIKTDPGLIETWRERGNPSEIGICHQGSPRSERPFTRDVPAKVFDPLNIKYSPFFHLTQGGQFENFADTAAAISVLDLVITVDTAVAHLAGAIGKPVWLLLSTDPDWRWGLHGESTFWYPSMRIFRQHKFRDWAGVIDDVIAALDQRVETKTEREDVAVIMARRIISRHHQEAAE